MKNSTYSFILAIATFTCGLWTSECHSQYTKLLDFTGATNGKHPNGTLISDGTFLYGTTTDGGTTDNGVIFKIMPDGSGYSKLLDFAGISNGNHPTGSLVTDGTNLFGMTYDGGANNLGVLFKIKPDGTGYSNLIAFSGSPAGSNPYGSLLYDGTFLYGMTFKGGTNDGGIVFKIKPDGTGYVKLLDFLGASNGGGPYGSLISDGTFLYGMTSYGGTANLGLVFKVKTDGTGYMKLLDFTGSANGSDPSGTLFYDGTFLYGMTVNGGANNDGNLFKLKPDGTAYSTLLDFAGLTNGKNPVGALVSDGTYLYGTTSTGGANSVKLVH